MWDRLMTGRAVFKVDPTTTGLRVQETRSSFLSTTVFLSGYRNHDRHDHLAPLQMLLHLHGYIKAFVQDSAPPSKHLDILDRQNLP